MPIFRSALSPCNWKMAETVQTRTLIVATGASARWLGLPNEQKLIGHGVSSCATCDGFFFRGKKIMVIGGGDSAMEEANFLSRFGSEVARCSSQRNVSALRKSCTTAPWPTRKSRFLRTRVVEDIYDVAKGEVTGVKLRNIENKGSLRSRSGRLLRRHRPHSQHQTICFAARSRSRRLHHYARRRRTNVAGVFHAGDVQDRTYRQAITASGAGCMAAIEAERFLESEGH